MKISPSGYMAIEIPYSPFMAAFGETCLINGMEFTYLFDGGVDRTGDRDVRGRFTIMTTDGTEALYEHGTQVTWRGRILRVEDWRDDNLPNFREYILSGTP